MTTLDAAIGEFQQRNSGWSRGGGLKNVERLREALAPAIPNSGVTAVTLVSFEANIGLLVSGVDYLAWGFIRGFFRTYVDLVTVVSRADVVRFDAQPNSMDGYDVEVMTRTGSITMAITRHLTNPRLEATLIAQTPPTGSTPIAQPPASQEPETFEQQRDALMRILEAHMPVERGDPSVPRVLPSEIVAMMERYGHHEFDPTAPGAMADVFVWDDTQQPLKPYAEADPAGFVGALASVVIPVGGWAVYGASHTVFYLAYDVTNANVNRAAIMDGAIDFLRERGVSPAQVHDFLRDRWIERGHSMATWPED